MTDITSLRLALDGAKGHYLSRWALSVGSAYAEAHAGAKATLKAQEDRERAQTELFFSLVMVGAASGLGALFAKRASKLVASGAFKSMSGTTATQTGGQSPVSYFFSKSASGLEGIVTSKTTKAMTALAKPNISLKTVLQNPLTYQNAMVAFVEESFALAYDSLRQIHESSALTDRQKEEKYDEMLASPLLRKVPPRKIFPDAKQGGGQIELCWYMAEVMASDSFQRVKVDNRTGDVMPGGGVISTIEITRRTTDPKYPKAYRKVKTEYNFLGIPSSNKGEYGQVVYDNLGGEIIDRINTLYSNYCGDKKSKFFNESTNHTTLQKAEVLYDELRQNLDRAM
ncbi:hypothetical protein KUV51_02905 [Tateyamaria omphalii]|uniref:hypothetical protein n=1 Tax=Tateyamaria omphalii TaxID=299262 RepID=UPI001C990CC7|nr:hypothetical protein [Tateyamaria omphalii]MBY5931939.1 hypothetical protein [Tateyamaria omphalii]